MSSEQLEVVRAFCEAGAAGDKERMSDRLDPDVVWFGTRGGLDQERVIRGREAFFEYYEEITELWDRFDAELESVDDVGDSVVVFWHEVGHSERADIEVERDTAAIFTVRGGLIVEVRGYLDRDDALRAAEADPSGD